MVEVEVGRIELLTTAAEHGAMMQTLQSRIQQLEDEVKKHRVVRRHLNGYNIFTKQRALERTGGIAFENINEFIDYAIENKVFEKKRVHRKKAVQGVLTLRSFTTETSTAYKELPGKQKKIYKEIAAYISNHPCLKGDQSYCDLVGKIKKIEADPRVKNSRN